MNTLWGHVQNIILRLSRLKYFIIRGDLGMSQWQPGESTKKINPVGEELDEELPQKCLFYSYLGSFRWDTSLSIFVAQRDSICESLQRDALP